MFQVISNRLTHLCYTIRPMQYMLVKQFSGTGLNESTKPKTPISKPQYSHPPFLIPSEHLSRPALMDQNTTLTYADLFRNSYILSQKIDRILPNPNTQTRISFLCNSDASYVITQWAIWWLNHVAVPLHSAYPASQLEYFITNSESLLIVGTESHADKLTQVSKSSGIPFITLHPEGYVPSTSFSDIEDIRHYCDGLMKEHLAGVGEWSARRDAMIIYTSGTTGRPKGVVLTHGNLHAQMGSMIQAWGWSESDVVLHCLPLHHVHGINKALMAPLSVGACVVMLPSFDPKAVWSSLIEPTTTQHHVTVFTAVPTMYSKLIECYNEVYAHSDSLREFVKFVCSRRIRLMLSGSSALPETVMAQWYDITGHHILKRYGMSEVVNVEWIISPTRNCHGTMVRDHGAPYTGALWLMLSGSSALPETVMAQWYEITGHHILERYGMSEVGMAISNPLEGLRRPGCVGLPMPGIQTQITSPNVDSPCGYDVIAKGDNHGVTVTEGRDGESGDLLLKGRTIFHRYYGNPSATADTFTKDDWLMTGDTAKITDDGVFKIVGRTSVDVIKSGGYKINALDIESHILTHPNVKECAVVGVSDITWGQKVAAVIVLENDEENLTRDDLKKWLADKIAHYEIPTVVKCIDAFDRNVMGKINKKEVVRTLFE